MHKIWIDFRDRTLLHPEWSNTTWLCRLNLRNHIKINNSNKLWVYKCYIIVFTILLYNYIFSTSILIIILLLYLPKYIILFSYSIITRDDLRFGWLVTTLVWAPFKQAVMYSCPFILLTVFSDTDFKIYSLS